MRVSNKQMVSIVKSDLFRNAEQLLKAQERVATRKLINRPSDDPIGMGKVLDYRKTISSIDQYDSNVATAKNRTEFTVTLLEMVLDLLDQANSIVSEQSVETTPELRQGAAQQVEGIYDQILGIANTKYEGAYLFAGHQSDTQPFTECAAITCGEKADIDGSDYFTIGSGHYLWYDKAGGDPDPTPSVPVGLIGIEVDISGISADDADAVANATMTAINNIAGSDYSATVPSDDLDKVEIVPNPVSGSYPDIVDVNTGFTTHDTKYVGDSGEIKIIVGEGAQVRINLTGNELFTGVDVASGANVFDDMKAIKDALEADPFVASDVSSLADNLANGTNQVLVAVVGQSITDNRLETTKNHWDKLKASFVNMLSKIEDTDLATAIVELQTQETAYEASLATAAKMLNKRSLIDFL
jgi:flagellin-like hook-associated protein FlgL